MYRSQVGRHVVGTRRKQLHCERLEDRRLLAADGLFSSTAADLASAASGSDGPLPPLETGSIHGRKWEDLNGDGRRGDDEGGLPGVTIFSDLNFNGQLDRNEPRTVTMRDDLTTDFDESGLYWLEDLQPGFHTVREIVPDGFEQTFPSLPPGFLPPPWGDPSVHVVFVDEGAAVEGINFGNRRIEPGSIHGRKWEDINGNGERDSNEPGLAGVIVYSDLNFNGQLDRAEPHTETMADDPDTDFDEGGLYWLQAVRPGRHVVREVVPDGYQQTYPHGPVFEPLAVPDPAEVVGAAAYTMWRDELGAPADSGAHAAEADLNGDGIVNHDDYDQWKRDFRDLPPEIPFPPIPPFPGAHIVVVESGQAVEHVDFGNQRILPGSIHGRKWEDADGNGERDAGEPGLAGVTIYSDLNFNGVLDRNEPHTVTMEDDPNTDFDEGGLYWLEQLRPRLHFIREVVPDGFLQTFPRDDFPFPEVPVDELDFIFPPPVGAHAVFLASGATVEGIDFGNQPIRPASVHGVKWLDRNGDGQRDDGEPGLAGVTIYSDRNFNGVLDRGEPHTVSLEDDPDTDFDEAGLFWLTELDPGHHSIREVVPDGFLQTFPHSDVLFGPNGEPLIGIPFPFPGGSHELFLRPGENVERINFGNQPIEPASVHGRKWNDRNGNAERDPDEPGLAGVTVYTDLNFNGVFDPNEPHTVTMEDDPDTDFDEAGLYWLENLRPGLHFIREVVPDGFVQTFPFGPVPLPVDPAPPLFPPDILPFPGDGAHVVFLGSGEGIDGIDFGNRPIPAGGSVHGVKWLDANGNAERDPDEPGVPGVIVYADRNRNGRLDAGEPRTETMRDDPFTDFDEAGLYWLEVPAGGHLIREVIPAGFEQTFPRHGIGPDGSFDGQANGDASIIEVHPDAIDVMLQAGEVFETEIIVTIEANLFVPIAIDAVASDPDAPFVNFSGVQENGGGGQTTVFHVQIVGDGSPHMFDVQLINAEFGELLGTVPVTIDVRHPDGAHVVFVEPGQSVDGIDFGNRPLERDGSVHGTKWLDRNGNGQRDPNEPGLPGVIVYADRNRNGRLDPEEPRTETMRDNPFTDFDEGGRYWLEGLPAGEYLIREVVPDGFEQTFPRPALEIGPDGTAEGVGTGDPNFAEVDPAAIDVRLDAGDVFETVVSITLHPFFIVPVEIDLFASSPDVPFMNHTGPQINGGGGDTSVFEIAIFGDGAPHAFTIDFVDLSGGNVLASVPVTVNAPRGDGAHFVIVRPGQAVEGVDFGNRPIDPPDPASVHGIKWLDRNGNGQREDNEPGLPGVIIYSDRNFNGRLDPGEPRTETMENDPTSLIDESGLYWLDDLDGGRHWIAEVVPDGFVQTFPSHPVIAIFPPPPGGGVHEIVLEPGDVVDGLDFGNHPVDPAAVHGIKWLDRNGNGERDADEPGLGGVIIYSDLNFNGRRDLEEPRTETMRDDPETDFDEGGRYWLEGLRPGLHAIREVVPDGFVQTFPLSDATSPLEVGAHFVALEPGEVVDGLNFGNRRIEPAEPGRVHGLKWLDRNGNSERDPNEPGVAEVIVYSDLNRNGRFDTDEPHTETVRDDPDTLANETGRYWLELRPGEHVLREVVPDGFVQTFPVSIAASPLEQGWHFVVLESGDVVDGLDFGNRPIDVAAAVLLGERGTAGEIAIDGGTTRGAPLRRTTFREPVTAVEGGDELLVVHQLQSSRGLSPRDAAFGDLAGGSVRENDTVAAGTTDELATTVWEAWDGTV